MRQFQCRHHMPCCLDIGEQIIGFHPCCARIDQRMHVDLRMIEQFFLQNEGDVLVLIMHQSQGRHGARRNA